MKTMTPYERLKAMVAGQPVDRPGVAVWKHCFMDDRYALDHYKWAAAFEDMNEWDFIKIMTTNVHMEAAYGAEVAWSKSEGSRTLLKAFPLKSPRACGQLKPIDVKNSPALMKEVEVAKRLVDKYHGKVPVIATCDLPASYLKMMYCGLRDPDRFHELLEYYPEDFINGEKVLTDVCQQFIEEYIKAGVDGIFLASNVCEPAFVTEEEYKEFILPYDVEVSKACDGKSWFNMLHVHGNGTVYFDLLTSAIHTEAISWHTFRSQVSMAEAVEKTNAILIGGLDHNGDFFLPTREERKARMTERVKAAAAAVPANRLIIAGGCSIVPPDCPEAQINILREVMDEIF